MICLQKNELSTTLNRRSVAGLLYVIFCIFSVGILEFGKYTYIADINRKHEAHAECIVEGPS